MNNFRDSVIAGCLFTRTQQQVLGILYGSPDQSFYQNEIIREAAMGKGAVIRELQRLCRAGLLLRDKRGNQTHYQANSSSIIYQELRGIIEKTLLRERLLRNAVKKLSGFLEQAFVYGPFAEGKENPGEEINMILVSDRLTPGGVESALAPASESLGREINFTILGKREYAEKITRKQPFLTHVMAQPKLWMLEKSNN